MAEQFENNRWKLTDGDGDLLDYFNGEDAAGAAYDERTAKEQSAILYSCMEDEEGGLTEWEYEQWNCDLDTGQFGEETN